MKMQFEVTYLDGRKVATAAGPKDFVAFERQFDQPIAGLGDKAGLRMEWIYYLAWSPLHRAGTESGDFDSFLDQVDDVASADTETPADVADPSLPASTPELSVS